MWLRAFGVSAVGPSGEDAVTGLGAKALGLMVYLASNSPTPVTRDAIVDLLWERVEPSQGKGSLRQELRSFKRNLGDELFETALDVTDHHVGLREGAVDYDAVRLEAAANSEDPNEKHYIGLRRWNRVRLHSRISPFLVCFRLSGTIS